MLPWGKRIWKKNNNETTTYFFLYTNSNYF
uniref:Uncharacterized protein n=1 Tax=Arundo donax TaxID=35708 RepID=A0A0A9ANI6_ARUDO